MAALLFPDAPTPGQLYPVNPGTSGVTQYRWDNTKGVWSAVLNTVSLGSPNQGAYNDYQWPLSDGAPDQQLTTNGSGTLTWEVAAAPSLQVVAIDPTQPFDGARFAFDLVKFGSVIPFVPTPSDNIIVFLGGVPQIPVNAYSVAGSTITFVEAPLFGTTFYAISNVLV
jgi:hypothetical protein